VDPLDDQHGTAIIAGAGLLNALLLVKKKIENIKVVVCGCGAAGFTCAKYFISLGVKKVSQASLSHHPFL
jgi:malate dehydrogenase (oxaloacetate-decarboxylating)(NADP+)